MSKQEKNLINYIVICINEFAKQCKISSKEAYIYLKNFKGIEFVDLIKTLDKDSIVQL